MEITLIIPILLGWAGGLFINYIADVLPYTRKLTQPTCPHCQTPFSWADYLTLHRCRSCGQRRSLRTGLVHLLTVASFVYLWLFPRIGLGLPLSLILLIYFGIVIVIDIEHRLILHTTSLFGALLGLIIGIYTQSKLNGLSAAIFTSLLGGVAGFVFMFLIYKGGELVARYRARKMRAAGLEEDDEEAFGSADVILTSILGLMLGWPNIILGLFTSAIIGGVIALLAVIQTFVKRRRAPDTLMTFIPYGPALVLGAFYILYFF